jgi:hypothetical protein
MPVQELFATPIQSDKKREEAFIVKAVIRYFEKPEAGQSSTGRLMESSILSALYRYFDTHHG